MNHNQEFYNQYYNDEFNAEFNHYTHDERDLLINSTGVQLANERTPNVYYCNQCLDLSGNEVSWFVNQRCKGCYGCTNSVACAADATQRRIQNTVRVSQSEYLENLAGLNVYTKPVAKYGFVNWNQGSDRAEPGQVHRNVPSYGASSTKTSITRMRPGSCSAASQGVDIKHGSYARYLARIKGRGPYRTQSVPAAAPVEGNKTKKYGIAYAHRDGGCFCVPQ